MNSFDITLFVIAYIIVFAVLMVTIHTINIWYHMEIITEEEKISLLKKI